MHNEMGEIAEKAREHYYAVGERAGYVVASAAFQVVLAIEADTEAYRHAWIGTHGQSKSERANAWLIAKGHRDQGDHHRMRALARLLEWLNA
jgi:hypothetical protein